LSDNELPKARDALHELAKKLRGSSAAVDKSKLDQMREAIQKTIQKAQERQNQLERRRQQLADEILKTKQNQGDAGIDEEPSLLAKKQAELDRLDRDLSEQRAARQQLDRLDRELQQAAEDLMKDLGLSAQDLDQGAEDLNRLEQREMSQQQKEDLRQKLQEMRELLRQQGQSGGSQVVRLKRFGRMARGQSGQRGSSQGGAGQSGDSSGGEDEQAQGPRGQTGGSAAQGQGQGQGPGSGGSPANAEGGQAWIVGPNGEKILMFSEARTRAGGAQGDDTANPSKAGARGRWGEGHDPHVQGQATHPNMGEIAKSIVGNREVVDGVLTCLLGAGTRCSKGCRGSARRCSSGRWPRRCRSLLAHPVHARPDAGRHPRHDRHRRDAGGRKSSSSARGPSSRTSCSPTRSTARRRRRRARCSRRCRSTASRSASETHVLEEPFVVLATQNPLEMEGTYPLPEAQLDRFFFKLHVPFPNRDELHEILDRTTGAGRHRAAREAVLDRERHPRDAEARAQVPVARHVQDYAIRVVQATHPDGPTRRTREALRALRQLAARRAVGAPRGQDSRALRRALRRERRRRARESRTRRSATACSSTSRARPKGSRPTRSSTPILKACPRRSRRERRKKSARSAVGTWLQCLKPCCDVAARVVRSRRRPAEDDELFDDEFQRKLDYLALVSRRVFSGRMRAERRTKKSGSGVEFADHRDYQPGDDFRYLDWNVYQRFERLLLRLYEEEEDLAIYFIVDTSASMGFGDGEEAPLRQAVCAALAYVGLANLDRVSIVSTSDQVWSGCRDARQGAHLQGLPLPARARAVRGRPTSATR
jgi:hypothetical protein